MRLYIKESSEALTEETARTLVAKKKETAGDIVIRQGKCPAQREEKYAIIKLYISIYIQRRGVAYEFYLCIAAVSKDLLELL